MQKVIGILSGGGSLPREIAQSISKRGYEVVIVAIQGEADPTELANYNVTFVKWGEVGRIIRIFKKNRVKEIIIIGSVNRPNLKNFRTDFGFYKNLYLLFNLIRAGGDDGVLRVVIRFIEKKGFRVVGPWEVAPELIVKDGPLGKHNVPDTLENDIKHGFNLVERLAPFDIGQSIVMHGGKVIAIEAAEGTDKMLERVARILPKKDKIGVLIKRSKPGQELRIDMPTIGPRTIEKILNAGLSGVVVQSGATLIAQRSLLVNRADERNIFVAGVSPPEPHAIKSDYSFKKDKTNDIDVAINVLRLLSKNSCGVIAIRRHIIGIECGEGLTELLERTSQLRQWGAWQFRRRGALVVSQYSGLSIDHISSAAGLGLSTIVLLSLDQKNISQHQLKLQKVAYSHGLELRIEVDLKTKEKEYRAA